MGGSTLRALLTEEGINWQICEIWFQRGEEATMYKKHSPYQSGWSFELAPPGKFDVGSSLLDLQFYTGFGSPEMPRFWAKDDKYIYIASQYDGATSVVKIPYNSNAFLTGDIIPFPGG